MNITELRKAVHELPPVPETGFSSLWLMYRREIKNHLLYDDPNNFMNFSTSKAVMFVGENIFSVKEAEVIFNAPDRERWLAATIESSVGSPERMSEYPHTSGNMVHQAFHHYQWEKATGKKVKDFKRIVEFGGGYGAQCVLCRRLGFTGEYVIYDLPEFSLLQKFYLSQLGIDFTPLCGDNNDRFYYPFQETDLMIGFYSLSEVGKKLRNAFFESVNPDNCLICHQDSYLSNKNMKGIFDDFMRSNRSYKWTTVEQPFIPGHRYVIGEKLNG